MAFKLNEEEFRPFVRQKDELSMCLRVILWGSRVIVPLKSRERVLEVLHSTYPVVNRMKSIARSYVWWPGMDTQIENRVKACHACQENVNSPAKAPVHPWEWPERAWSRVHMLAHLRDKCF